MALGGGNFLVQNKTLPGAYINFVSKERASATLSDRGYVAMPLVLNWGSGDSVMTITNEDFIKSSMKYFGYGYSADELKGLRDLFTNATTLYAYRLNTGGNKASNAFGTAKYEGELGNTICTAIETNYMLDNIVDADDYTTGSYEGNMVLDDYFTIAMNDKLDSDTGEVIQTHSWKIETKANGEDSIVCFNMNGAIGSHINGVARALQVNVPRVEGACAIKVYVRCNNESNDTAIGMYTFGMSDTSAGVITLVGEKREVSADSTFTTITFPVNKAGTYYIGGDAGISIAWAELSMSNYNVTTYFNGEKVEEQAVGSVSELESDYVDYDTTATLTTTAGTYMTGGSNGVVSAAKYQKALTALEGYSFNTLGCISDDDTIKKLFVEYTKRLRDECGVKFQCVVHNYEADYEGVINVINDVSDGVVGNELVYWVTGASAGCQVNKSITNTTYNGEYKVVCDYSQTELTNLIKEGKLVFHKVNDDVRVLKDINSFVSTVTDKNSDFCLNQVIRVLDQIGNDVAVLFNTYYCGKVPNDKAGRTSLWSDIVKLCNDLEGIRAIEEFEDEDCVVSAGETKTSVVVDLSVYPTCAMDTLYMTVYVQ